MREILGLLSDKMAPKFKLGTFLLRSEGTESWSAMVMRLMRYKDGSKTEV